jgi:hypothetical protein
MSPSALPSTSSRTSPHTSPSTTRVHRQAPRLFVSEPCSERTSPSTSPMRMSLISAYFSEYLAKYLAKYVSKYLPRGQRRWPIKPIRTIHIVETQTVFWQKTQQQSNDTPTSPNQSNNSLATRFGSLRHVLIHVFNGRGLRTSIRKAVQGFQQKYQPGVALRNERVPHDMNPQGDIGQ